MAMVPICYKRPYNDQNVWTPRLIKQGERGFMCEYLSIEEGYKCLSSILGDKSRRWHVLYPSTDILIKTRTRGGLIGASVNHKVCSAGSHLRSVPENASQREHLCMVRESNTNKKQLRSLDSYFKKLQNKANRLPYADSSNKIIDLLDKSCQSNLNMGLGSLEDYFIKLNEAANSKLCLPSTSNEETIESKPEEPISISKDSKRGYDRKLKSYMEFRRMDGPEKSQVPQQYDEISDFYLINILASVNIAVFLFEIASPIRNSELELFSLPLIYGAKINDLILIGEWWRLVTPMFLHSGLLHVALGCWALLTFAPQVCKGYGSFTFFLIYILGGISGNLISFLHTPEPTVGGTGPVFAIIGAWLIYQIQNKDVIAKDVSDNMFQKAIITTALSFVLSNFGPIDDWTHFGAALSGIVYGFFTSPMLQLDDASSKSTSQEEGITLVRRNAVDPCKSLLVFAILILVLSTLLFFIGPPLNNMLASNDAYSF